MKTLSVLMTAHNAERWLDSAISSVRSQTFTEFEFLVLDDGSTDGTEAIIRGHAAEDERVRCFSEPQQGLTKGLQFLIDKCTGELIARMDADDICEPERFEQQVASMESFAEVVCCGTWATEIDADGTPFGIWRTPTDHGEIDSQHMLGMGGGVIHPSAMLRRNALHKIGGYDTQWPIAQDYDLWLRLAEVGRLMNIPSRLLRYRRACSAISMSKRAEQLAAVEAIHRAAVKRRRVRNEVTEYANASNSVALDSDWFASRAITEGFAPAAFKHSLRALVACPSEGRRWRQFSQSASMLTKSLRRRAA